MRVIEKWEKSIFMIYSVFKKRFQFKIKQLNICEKAHKISKNVLNSKKVQKLSGKFKNSTFLEENQSLGN